MPVQSFTVPTGLNKSAFVEIFGCCNDTSGDPVHFYFPKPHNVYVRPFSSRNSSGFYILIVKDECPSCFLLLIILLALGEQRQCIGYGNFKLLAMMCVGLPIFIFAVYHESVVFVLLLK
jgi:hypothetical protein